MSTAGTTQAETQAGSDGNGRAAETVARRERLLAAAAELAAAGGYEAVHMRAVASRAHVALGTLYRHFSSKDQLLVAVLAHQAATLASTDPAAAAAVGAVEARQRSMLADAIGSGASEPGNAGRGPARSNELDEVLRTLGHVWFSVMIAWVAGKLDRAGVRHDLDVAARLLLPGDELAAPGTTSGGGSR